MLLGMVYSPVRGSIACLLSLLLLLSAAQLPGAEAAQLEWSAGPGFRSAPLLVPVGGKTGFSLLSGSATGIQFTNTLSEANASQNQIRLNGSGVALGDVDGDGWCDIFVCALEGKVALYKNLGKMRFTNVSAASGLDFAEHFTTGAAFADIDGDRDLDLLVNAIGTGTRLFLNDGKGAFREATEAGLVRRFGAMTCALADVDGDGDLDLYVTNYRTNTVRTTGFALLNVGGRRMIRPEDRGRLVIAPNGRVFENGDPDVLYLNDGKGHFSPQSWTDGTFLDEEGRPLVMAPPEWGLAAMFRDINGDRLPDIYVCNDFHSPDRIWINQGKGRFREIPRLALRHTATFSMSVDFADVDRDGRDDILVSDMTSRMHGRQLMQIAGMDPYEIRPGVFTDRPQLDRTVLQWNRGDGTYAEIAHYAGLENSEWNWSVLFLDVDLDGYEDLLAATGHMFDTQDLDAQAAIQARGPWPPDKAPGKLLLLPPLRQAKLAFRNRGDLTFQECGHAWGFDQVGVSHGMALADLDNDGDLDLVVNNLNAALGVYRNDSSMPRIAVRLKGLPGNTAGTGARIKVAGGPVLQAQEMICGGRYLSSDDAIRVFAMGTREAVSGPPPQAMTIEVTWRSGKRSDIPAKANHVYEIDEAGAEMNPTEAPDAVSGKGTPMFQDVSGLLQHVHFEQPFDDFARQSLLPKRLSQLGPGVCWWDVNGDGWEDLLIGTGRSGRLAYYENNGKGGFALVDKAPWNVPTARDLTALLGWNTNAIIAGTANYEDGIPAGSAAVLYRRGQAQATDVVAAWDGSVGPLALCDYNGDGVLDLFVGGRARPGQYPKPASSRLYRGGLGGFEIDQTNSVALANLGLVSGAVWSDLDGDGWAELIVACEWGPLRVFQNKHGVMKEITPMVILTGAGRSGSTTPLNQLTGFWNGVTTGDLDGDGRLDIIASNWGRNTKYRASRAQPLRIYYGDFNQDGWMAMVESCFDEAGREAPVRDLLALSSGMPWVRARFQTHEAYAKATVADILGTAIGSAGKVEAATLDSMVLFNRGDRYEAVPLAREAQFAPAFAVVVGDMDGDGAEDVFLSQNFYATEPKTPRCDAGRGLWLRGDGKGGLTPVPGQASGIEVYGEQRGAALGDYDHDGRVDLVVTQNGSQTRLFRNQGARPGVRVRLVGGAGNPAGIGACLQVGMGGTWGPVREVHGGSGYWSQDAVVQVLAVPGPGAKVRVRWPGGKTVEVPVPEGGGELGLRSP